MTNDSGGSTPKISQDALYGILGEITAFIVPQSEADPAAIYSQALAAFGNAVGRKPFFQVERTRHHTNLFLNLVGRTAVGRKGTALDYIRVLFNHADPLYSEHFLKGLSTGEGLIWAARDAVYKSEYNKTKKRAERIQVDAGVDDKRLFVTETEFARPIKAMARPTNTLSTILRDAWDTGNLATMTRTDAVKATNAHISLVGHITAAELNQELSECDYFNGFANRFLWNVVKRSQCLPDGGSLDDGILIDYASVLGERLSAAEQVGQMTRSDGACALWHQVYPKLTAERDGMLGAATSRAEAQVLRVSMILALTDGAAVIERQHLEAALAFWKYCFASARLLFGHRLSDSKAQQILEALRQHPDGMTRWQITDEVFARHIKSERLEAALQVLLKAELAYCKVEQTAGRDAERWFAMP